MIWVGIAEALVIALLVFLMVRERERSDEILADFCKEFARERAELIAAVKSPTYLPRTAGTPRPEAPRQPRDQRALAAVGTIGVAKPPGPGTEDEDDG